VKIDSRLLYSVLNSFFRYAGASTHTHTHTHTHTRARARDVGAFSLVNQNSNNIGFS